MKIYIDLQKNAITKVITKDSAYEGDIFSNTFELLIYNYSNTNWFVTMSQLAPNHREAGDFTADALQENESNIVEENDITYLKFTFTMSDGWVLMKGASNFYIWINTLNPTTRKCVGKVIVNLIESSNNYFIQDPLFNPAIKEYIDAKQAEQDETIAGLGQLKPSGVATSSQILAFTEDKGIYISNTNGHWYYWDATLSTPSYKDSGMMYSSEIDNAKIDNVWEIETIQLVNSNEPETFKINDTSVVDLLTSKKLYIIEFGIAYDTTINELVTTSEKTIFYLESFDDELVYKSIPKFENGAVVSYQLNLYYQNNEYVLDFTYTTNGLKKAYSPANLISGLAKSNDSTQSIVAGNIAVSKLTIGTSNVASGNNTLAQGSAVKAVGDGSVAMGLGAEAYGMIAHSFGYVTIAHSFQQVFGVANIEDSYSDYENAGADDSLIEIVGGGFTTKSPDNLRVTTLAGNQYIKGDLIYDTTFTSTTVTHDGVVYKKTTKTGTSLKQKITNIEQAIANIPSGGTDVGLSVVNGKISITYEEQEEE